ncbi:hypothetical protein J4E08_19905 [Sagittula sp. NFXS13]|uniref:hypothetical protein n=1 Tax=Sagittula sp. NFXS13 TaxID=2819095 RepID=UPI0032DEFCA6
MAFASRDAIDRDGKPWKILLHQGQEGKDTVPKIVAMVRWGGNLFVINLLNIAAAC